MRQEKGTSYVEIGTEGVAMATADYLSTSQCVFTYLERLCPMSAKFLCPFLLSNRPEILTFHAEPGGWMPERRRNASACDTEACSHACPWIRGGLSRRDRLRRVVLGHLLDMKRQEYCAVRITGSRENLSTMEYGTGWAAKKLAAQFR